MSSQRGEGSGSFLSILAGIIILLAGAAAELLRLLFIFLMERQACMT